MEQYASLIGVVLEKLDQTYKELKFNYDGLSSVLEQHSDEERRKVPELITMAELRDTYADMIRALEERLPGIKS